MKKYLPLLLLMFSLYGKAQVTQTMIPKPPLVYDSATGNFYADLSAYATVNSLSVYAKTTALSSYATLSSLLSYATITSQNAIISSQNAIIAKMKSDSMAMDKKFTALTLPKRTLKYYADHTLDANDAGHLIKMYCKNCKLYAPQLTDDFVCTIKCDSIYSVTIVPTGTTKWAKGTIKTITGDLRPYNLWYEDFNLINIR